MELDKEMQEWIDRKLTEFQENPLEAYDSICRKLVLAIGQKMQMPNSVPVHTVFTTAYFSTSKLLEVIPKEVKTPPQNPTGDRILSTGVHVPPKREDEPALSDAVTNLIAAYSKYLELLSDEIQELVGIAIIHGFKSKRIIDGFKCREKIEKAQEQVTALLENPRQTPA